MEPNQIQPVQSAGAQSEGSKFLIPGAIVLAGAFVALAIYAGGGKTVATGNGNVAEAQIIPLHEKDHIRGSANAEVVIIEYSDTECPFCKVYHNTMLEVMSAYNGKVAWVYRHLPIPQLHARATKEAEATECVAELGGNEAFWKYLDKVFETTNSNDSLDPFQLPKLAVEVGIDEAKFNECLASGKYTSSVQKSAQEGFASGAKGTPFSLIMTEKGLQATVNGAEPIGTVKAKLDAILK
jgi:protein-disulfide isomerase